MPAAPYRKPSVFVTAFDGPFPGDATDLGEIGPMILATSLKLRCGATRPSVGTRVVDVVVVVGGTVAVVVVVGGPGVVGDDLPDQFVVVLAFDPHRFNPDLTSVAGLEVHFVGPEPPSRPAAGNPFANAVVVIDSTFPASGLVDVPHELGHALFNLPDEYVGRRFGFDARTDLSSWPSCAEDRAEADEWWADLVGDVDPMVDIWAAEMDESGFPIGDPAGIAASVTVSNVDQGCYGVTGSLRATFGSLMNNSIPVLGSVNRKWAMQILDLWDGAPRS